MFPITIIPNIINTSEHKYDAEALGIYGIAQNAFSYMVLVPSAMSQLFYVKMGKEYGASGNIGTWYIIIKEQKIYDVAVPRATLSIFAPINIT